MEVIELLSEYDERHLPRQTDRKKTEIIILSDESRDYHSQVNLQNGDAISEIADETTNLESVALVPMTSSQTMMHKSKMAETSRSRSILDLNNWISSSEDDSFTKDLLGGHTPKRLKLTKHNSGAKSVLNSSPITERISQPLESIPESLSPIRPRTQMPFVKPKGVKRHLTIKADSSDPISSSSNLPSPVKPTLLGALIQTPIGESTPASSKKKEYSPKEWRDANKAVRKKDDILSEMVIEIALNLKDAIANDYFEQVFTLPKVRNTYFNLPMISWKRRIKARYDERRDIFVPCEPTEVCERIIVLYFHSEEFIGKLQEHTLEETIQRAKERAVMEDPSIDYHIILMVVGFREYIRKLQSVEHKRYRQQMLERMSEQSTRNKENTEIPIKATEAQSLIMETEVSLGLNVFFPKSEEEAIDWLHSFTYTIGASLYDKNERNPQFANFGSVRLGTDSKSTFIEMMKRFSLMTHQKAEKLYEYYTSVGSLFKRFSDHDDLGTVNGKGIVPPSVNNSMRRFFRATDPDEVIVD